MDSRNCVHEFISSLGRNYSYISKQGKTKVFKKVVGSLTPRYQSKQKKISRVKKLLSLHSQHIVSLLKSHYNQHKVQLTYKYFEGTSLSQCRGSEISNQLMSQMIVQFVKAMQECEERQVNHFRLCPTCILLKKDMYVLGKIFLVVTDFSLGKDFCTDQELERLSFYQFMHPDLIKGEDKNIFDNYDPQYDMWSFGVVLYMLVYDRHPFAEDDRFSPQRLAKYQTNPKQLSFPNTNSSFKDLIMRLLDLKYPFRKWQQVYQYLLKQGNCLKISFWPFRVVCAQQSRLVGLFTSVICMLQGRNYKSVHPFWQNTIALTEFGCTLYFFMAFLHNELFRKSFSAFWSLFEESQQYPYPIIAISNCLDHERAGMLQLVGNNGYKFNFKQFPDVAERMMVLAAELATTAGEYKSRCVSYRQGLINRQWESVRIFEVFCSEIQRVGSSSNSLKSLQKLYLSDVLHNLSRTAFGHRLMKDELRSWRE